MQYKEVAGGICAPKGFAAAGVHCGIRANHSEKYDMALIKADVRCAAAGVYTTNKVCGAPIKVDRAHLADGYAQAIVVNSGNANTCAANGVALAEECCELVGKALNIDAKDVLPSSTGVIGQPMVIDPFARGIPAAAAKLAADAQGSTAEQVAEGIAAYYKDAATVKVHGLNETLPENGLYSNAMAGTDRMELYLTVTAAGDQMMLVSLFDTLGKGSSGAAIQCMNLMLGLPETQGLE